VLTEIIKDALVHRDAKHTFGVAILVHSGMFDEFSLSAGN
jgi:hypothetical protein